MSRSSQYFTDLTTGIGEGWNRFWYTPADARPLAPVRIGTGLLGLYFFYSHTADLVRWFGPRGVLNIDTARRLAGDESDAMWRPSLLYLTEAPELLWAVHLLGFVALAAMTAGLFTRLSTLLSLALVLSYVHRGPLITGPLEPVLSLLLCYLAIGPAGAHLSLDRLLGWQKSPLASALLGTTAGSTWTANLSLRLIQTHLAGFYLMMGLTKLAGDTWWNGTAVWWLIAHADSRIVDLTWLGRQPFVVNFWTHAIVFFELSFGLLIWNRLARPLLLLWAVPMWLLFGLVSGELAFSAIMLVANLAFVPPDVWRQKVEHPALNT